MLRIHTFLIWRFVSALIRGNKCDAYYTEVQNIRAADQKQTTSCKRLYFKIKAGRNCTKWLKSVGDSFLFTIPLSTCLQQNPNRKLPLVITIVLVQAVFCCWWPLNSSQLGLKAFSCGNEITVIDLVCTYCTIVKSLYAITVFSLNLYVHKHSYTLIAFVIIKRSPFLLTCVLRINSWCVTCNEQYIFKVKLYTLIGFRPMVLTVVTHNILSHMRSM